MIGSAADGGQDDRYWAPTAGTGPDGSVDLPGYRDFVEIARGGDSVVYRARQDGLGRYVAVKILLLDDAAAVARFRRELDLTVGLGRQHPHVVSVIDTGVTGAGQPCIVMEYYDHGSLHDRLRTHGPLPAADVVAVGVVVADALAFAHAQGVLHRDVKPQNILVLPTSYVLADFGIARRVDAGHSGSLERFSYRHAAPQVLDGEPPAVSDDVWSLGSTLFTLLDGRPPFAVDDPQEDTALAYLRRVRTAPARGLTRDDLPPGLAELIARCLSKRREDRYQSAEALRTQLEGIAAQARAWAPSIPVRPVALPPPAEPPPAEPPPAEPVPVAPSALIHLEDAGWAPAPARTDPEPTGAHSPPAEPVPETGRPPGVRWRRVGVVAGIAVLLGSAVGVAGVALGHPSAPPPAPAPSLGQPVGAYAGPVPSPSGPLQADVGDPDLAPVITGLTDRGTSVVLTWTDPSRGQATFVVVEVIGSSGQALREVRPGTTQAVIEGLDPAQRRYCFAVVALAGARRAASSTHCVARS